MAKFNVISPLNLGGERFGIGESVDMTLKAAAELIECGVLERTEPSKPASKSGDAEEK